MSKRKHRGSRGATETHPDAGTIRHSSLVIIPLSFFTLIVLHFSLLFLTPRSQADGYVWYERLWGFDNIEYFSTPYVACAYALAIMITIPYCNNYLRSALSNFFNEGLILRLRRIKYVLFVTIAVISGIVFYGLRVKYPFLGDMDIRVGQTLEKNFFTSEYLTMWSAYQIHHALNLVTEISGKQTFVLLSVISGSIFVYLILLTADLLGKDFAQKSAMCLCSFSMGSILLFFGYIEVYPIPAVLVILYIYSTLLWIKDRTGFVLPLVVLMVAMGFHLMAIGLVPSFVYVVSEKYCDKWRVLAYLRGQAFLLWCLAAMPVVFWVAAALQLADLMPVFFEPSRPQVMTLLSAQHFWEFLNSQILAAGAASLVLPVLVVLLVRGAVCFDAVSRFLAAAALFMLFIAFAVNKMRGSADWDICAFPALIYVLMVAYVLYKGTPARFPGDRVSYIISIMIVFNLLNTVPWIMINAGDKSIKKIASMLETDPGHYYMTRLPALYNLALSYKANGLMQESLNCYEKIYTKFHSNPRSHMVYANALIRSGRLDKGIMILSQLLQHNPYYSEAYPLVIQCYHAVNQEDKIIELLERLFKLYEHDPETCHKYFANEHMIQYFTYIFTNKYQRVNDAIAMDRVKAVINKLEQRK